MTAGRFASNANAMPAGDREGVFSQESIWLTEVKDGKRTGGVGQLGLAGATLTLWHLYTTPTESTQHVWDDVVFDLVLGEPGEHRQQPQHNGFELG